MENIYEKAHEAIRNDPSPLAKKPHAKPSDPTKVKLWKAKKLTLATRKNKIQQRKRAILAKIKGE